jgi:hypothetical protein
VYLEGEATRRDVLSRDHHGPRAILNAAERLAGGYGRRCGELRQDLAIAEAQLRDYQARLGRPFDHDQYQSQLTALRDQLKQRLSRAAPEPDGDAGPCASELAERIKALRAAHTIDAAPDRAPHKQADAAEPVTARIRRNAETKAVEPAKGPPASSPSAAFQERCLAKQREPALSLP